MTRTLAKIQGEYIRYFEPAKRCCFFGDADIDADGSSGNTYNDPYFQPDTTYHFKGKALNSETTKFIVVPPIVVSGVGPVVLGCHARVTDFRTGKRCLAVVGDLGPMFKVGEVSIAAARALDIPWHPVTGGLQEFCFFYELWPGQPAAVDGVVYTLQPS